jgi:hypothetical protein
MNSIRKIVSYYYLPLSILLIKMERRSKDRDHSTLDQYRDATLGKSEKRTLGEGQLGWIRTRHKPTAKRVSALIIPAATSTIPIP